MNAVEEDRRAWRMVVRKPIVKQTRIATAEDEARLQQLLGREVDYRKYNIMQDDNGEYPILKQVLAQTYDYVN